MNPDTLKMKALREVGPRNGLYLRVSAAEAFANYFASTGLLLAEEAGHCRIRQKRYLEVARQWAEASRLLRNLLRLCLFK